MPSSAVKAIVFDYGGVVGHNFNWQDFAQELHELRRYKDFHDLLNDLRQQWDNAVKGGDTKPFWQALSSEAGESIEKIRKTFIQLAQPDERMLKLIDKLRQKYKLAILSNQISDWLGVIIEQNKLQDRFDLIVTSYDEGLRKPDSEIYQRTAQKLGVPAGEIVFVDDTQRNIDAANQLGLQGLLFKDYEQLITDLKKLGAVL